MSQYIDFDNDREDCFSVLEILVAIVLVSMMGFTILVASTTSVRYQKYSEISNVAMNLAVSKAEQLSGVTLNNLNDTYDGTESNVEADDHNVRFSRETDVTVNANGSRTIEVTVSSSSMYLPKPVTFSTTLSPWES